MSKEVEEKVVPQKQMEQKLIAKKDFKFKHDKIVYEIKKGDEVKVPKKFLQNLKTEKVI